MLRERFNEQKIYLVGHSWGTIIGVRAAQARPDLFHAYIGSAQMVDVLETDQSIYHSVLAHSRRTGDVRSVQKLEAQGETALSGQEPCSTVMLFSLSVNIVSMNFLTFKMKRIVVTATSSC